MSKLDLAPGLRLDPDFFGGSAFGLLAKRGWGKTYMARVIAEELWPARIPFVFLDPMDVAWGLRSSADGHKDGIPVPIFGGPKGDAPLEPTAGKMMADLVVDEGLSMVLSLKHFGSRTTERRFAMDFLERLYRRNRDLVHLLIDEADLFAPQKPRGQDQHLLAITENIVRRGRNNGIGCTLMTQRPAVLNKDVLNQVDGLVVGRMVGPLDRNAIDGWVKESGDLDEGKQVKATLPELQNGEAWVWIPEQGILKRVQIREAHTFDSSPTKKRGQSRREPKSYADVDMGAVQAKMADTIERAKKDDPRELRQEIARLEAELSKRPDELEVKEIEVEVEVEKLVEVPAITDDQLKVLTSTAESLGTAVHALREVCESGGRPRPDDTPRPSPTDRRERRQGQEGRSRPRSKPPPAREPGAPVAASRQGARPPAGDDVNLKKGARNILALLASLHPNTVPRRQAAVQCGIKSRGSTFSAYLSNLRTPGFIYEEGDRLGITQEGFDYLGETPQAAPTAAEVLDKWRSKLKRGARDMLDALIAEYPDGLDRDELAASGDSEINPTGSTLSAYLSNLRTAELIAERGGRVFLAEEFAEVAT